MRTPEEMFPIVEDWLESGLTQKEYSIQHDIALHILPYWVGKYRKCQEEDLERIPSFSPVSLSPSLSKNIELVLPNGIMISIPTGALSQISPSHLHRLLQLCLG